MSTAVKAPPTTIARDSQSPVLVAMADTFIGSMGHPGSPIRVAASMEETFRRLPSSPDRRRPGPPLWHVPPHRPARAVSPLAARAAREGDVVLVDQPHHVPAPALPGLQAAVTARLPRRYRGRRHQSGLARNRLSGAGLSAARDPQEHPNHDARR